MSPLEIGLLILLWLALCFAIGKHLALSNARGQVERWRDDYRNLHEAAAAVRAAQAERKRVTTPNDMKKANLALDTAIEELI